MLPKSYDKVSEETKITVQQYIARATGFLQGKNGECDERIRTTMDNIENGAMKEALEMALETHEKRHQPCTAELFAQRFAYLVWEAAIGGDVQDWPYEFTTSVDSGPLAPDFLDAIGKTDVVTMNPYLIDRKQNVKNEQGLKEEATEKKEVTDKEVTDKEATDKKATDKKETDKKETDKKETDKKETDKKETRDKKEETPEETPEEKAKLTLPSETIHEEPTTLKSAIFNTLDAQEAYANKKKRKNGEPETSEPKRRRGNDGEKIPSGSSTQLSTHEQWSGIPLTAIQVQIMNAGLMEAIWETRIYDGDNIYYDAGVFAVKIPKHKAWQMLGKKIDMVCWFVQMRWDPVRLYTCDLGHSVQVGLWVPKSQSQGEMEEIVRYKSEELYNLLRHWSCQAQGTGTQSLANYLDSYIKQYRIR